MVIQDSSIYASSPDYNVGHPTTQAIAKGVQLLRPGIAKESSTSMHARRLEPSDIEFFKSYGYLIKRGVLATETDAISQANELFWDSVPKQALRRDDPQSWLDDPASHWEEADHARVGSLVGTNWKMRSRGIRGIGTESCLVAGLANHPKMLKLASAFLAAPVRPVHRARGIYGVFPMRDEAHDRLFPHGDYMASQLSAMVLLGDVGPNCGGFTLWPGSHHRMHLCWDRVSGSVITGERAETYPAMRDQLLKDTEPVEFTGRAGDVIFWHPRVIHSAGVNRSGDSAEPMVRLIAPIDYQRAGETYLDDLEFGPGPKYQWWVDTRNVQEDVASAPDNIWFGWSFE